MSVAGEIGKNLFGAAKGRFSIDNPVQASTEVHALGKGVRGGKMRKLTEETQFICMRSSVEFS